MLAVK